MDYMSEPAARNWCEKAAEPYQISIENFARMVREYIEKKMCIRDSVGGTPHLQS